MRYSNPLSTGGALSPMSSPPAPVSEEPQYYDVSEAGSDAGGYMDVPRHSGGSDGFVNPLMAGERASGEAGVLSVAHRCLVLVLLPSSQKQSRPLPASPLSLFSRFRSLATAAADCVPVGASVHRQPSVLARRVQPRH